MANMDGLRAVQEAVNSMEMEGFHPTEEDKRLAYLCVTGQISYEEVLRSVLDDMSGDHSTTEDQTYRKHPSIEDESPSSHR